MTEFWMESSDQDQLRAGCDCGWLGEWRDFGRDAANDGDTHLTECHPLAGEDQCTCTPQVFARRHRDELLLAWFWPGGPMWLQPGGGVPIEVTSGQFATSVELGWSRLDVAPGAAGVWVMAPTGPTYFELVR